MCVCPLCDEVLVSKLVVVRFQFRNSKMCGKKGSRSFRVIDEEGEYKEGSGNIVEYNGGIQLTCTP